MNCKHFCPVIPRHEAICGLNLKTSEVSKTSEVLLPRIVVVQECDATDDEKRFAAGNKNKKLSYRN